MAVDNLFRMPVILIDGRKEDQGKNLGIPGEANIEYVVGDLEVPADDFIGVVDRWLPTDESYEKAQEGHFEACYVIFGHSGNWVCVWNKEKFKRKLREHQAAQAGDDKTIVLNMEQVEYLKSLADKGEVDDEEQGDLHK